MAIHVAWILTQPLYGLVFNQYGHQLGMVAWPNGLLADHRFRVYEHEDMSNNGGDIYKRLYLHDQYYNTFTEIDYPTLDNMTIYLTSAFFYQPFVCHC